jgi:hypothetical protein
VGRPLYCAPRRRARTVPGSPAMADPTAVQPAPVRVVEVTAERSADDPPEIPWALQPPPGRVALQLRTTLPRVLVGAGLARRPDLVEAVRNIPGVAAVATSPVGGTFVVGGPGWLGLCAIGTLPEGPRRAPLDWMLDALRAWFAAALGPLGLEVATGRVDGAWCPGFSDVAVGGRKLAGLGFRVTRGVVVVRGMLAVRRVSDADLQVLRACHALIDLGVERAALTSLAEASGDGSWDDARALARLRAVAT